MGGRRGPIGVQPAAPTPHAAVGRFGAEWKGRPATLVWLTSWRRGALASNGCSGGEQLKKYPQGGPPGPDAAEPVPFELLCMFCAV